MRRNWCGPEPRRRRRDYTAGAFRPKDMALTARGPQAPNRQPKLPTGLAQALSRERPFAKDPGPARSGTGGRPSATIKSARAADRRASWG